MYRLEHPEYLHTLWIIPLLVIAFLAYRMWQKRAQKLWGEEALLAKMASKKSNAKAGIKFAIICLSLVFLAIGLANPQVGTKTETVTRRGVDIVFALDVSKSMLAEDVAPSRIEKAKHLISKIIDELSGDRVGIIAYAGNAYPLLPITTDYAAAKLAISSASPDFIPTQGTALDMALEYSLNYFDDASEASKILVILSDGEDHEDNWKEEITQLNQKNIIVYSIGLGTKKGGPIPEKRANRIVGYKKDRNGEVVITRLNGTILREIAQATNGSYIDGDNVNNAVKMIAESTAGMNKAEIEEKVFTDYEDQFQWFIAIAIILLLVELSIANRKTAWLAKWGINNKDVK